MHIKAAKLVTNQKCVALNGHKIKGENQYYMIPLWHVVMNNWKFINIERKRTKLQGKTNIIQMTMKAKCF